MPSLRTPPRSGAGAAGAPAGGGGDVESGVVSTAIPGAIPPSSRRAVYAVTLVAALFWALVLLFVAYVRYGGDIRGLLCIGENVYLPAVFEAVPRAGPAGYDGQQYAALATDPLLLKFDTTRALDSPPYRATRILVPLLAWGLALGKPAPAIITYQLLCWGLGLAAVLLVARWLAADGRSPWWAIPLVCSAGLAAAMIRSTPDAAALCLMLAALWLHARGRYPLAVAVAAAAVLARETSYLAVLAIAIDELRRRRVMRAAAFTLVPLVPFVAWKLYLRSVLGVSIAIGGPSFTTPFGWAPEKLAEVFANSGIAWQELFGLLAIAATTLAFIMVASRPSAWAAPELAFLAFCALGLVLTYDAYVETWGYARILIAVPFLATLVAERQSSPSRRWPLRVIAFFYLLAGLTMMRWEMREALNGRSLLAALRAGPAATGKPVQGGGPTVDGLPTLYVLPVANSRGRAGARWQTWLELTNLGTTENRVFVDLLPAGRAGSSALRATVTLGPGQTRAWRNTLNQLFGFSGSGALRLSPLGGPVSVNGRTANVAGGDAQAPLLPAIGEDRAIRTGEQATLRGLSHDPSFGAAVRTNVGLLNLTARRIRVRIQAYDAQGRRLGQLEGELPSRGFLQVDDIFAKAKAGTVSDGSAVVEAITPGGAFLAYASVIRGPTAPVVYVFPEQEREAASPAPK